MLPPEFNRETFKSFCKDESRSISQDNEESGSGDAAKQSICIAIVRDTSDEVNMRLFRIVVMLIGIFLHHRRSLTNSASKFADSKGKKLMTSLLRFRRCKICTKFSLFENISF